MELAPYGVPLSFEVTYDSPLLDVGMSVYDDSGADPVLVFGPVLMDLVAGYTYRGKFTAQADRSYIIIKAVYEDDSLEVYSTGYSPGSESIYAQAIGGGGSTPIENVVGYVIDDGTVVGEVNCG